MFPWENFILKFGEINGGTMTEKTLVLIKPDAYKNRAPILTCLLRNGFEIKQSRTIEKMSQVLIYQHYHEHTNQPYFPEIVEFMSSGPVLAICVEGNNAISKIRELVGPTNPAEAPKGTIRQVFGTDKMRNAIHASENEESAKRELNLFFPFLY